MATRCYIQLLGGLQVQQGDQVVSRFRTQKTASLLAYLAYFRKRAHQRDDLIALFWPEADPEAGRTSLRTALSSLRRQLEPPGAGGSVLVAGRESVQLHAHTVSTDVEQFVSALKAASQASEQQAQARHLKEAVALVKGPLLPGFYEDWVLQERERIEQAYLGALRLLVRTLEPLGDREGAIAAGHRLIAVDPLSEEGYVHLMRLYAAVGQPQAGLQQYRALAQTLERELDETPSEEAQALARSLEQQSQETAESRAKVALVPDTLRQQTLSAPSLPILREPVAREAALPMQLTHFFGREQEIAQIKDRLDDSSIRLLTLTGAGGSGKTRLAVEAARQLSGRFAGAVWFVALSDIAEASLISQTIASAMGLSLSADADPLDPVAQSLSGRTCLLVLDNFEHLAGEGAAVVMELVERIPTLSLLVTSRQRLDIGGERELAVAPLPTPDPADASQSLETVASVQLLVDRVQALRPDFRITSQNAPTISALCQRLEGIPLAIELAAAWAGTLTPDQMLARLEHRFQLLASKRKDLSPRHRTLRAA